MTPDALAALHRAAMKHGAWDAKDFEDLLVTPGTFLALPPPPFQKYATAPAFALGRVTLDEAELLTLVTDPAAQRRGIGRSTLEAFEKEAGTRGAVTGFLEVAESNAPAIALYLGAGWTETGRRRGYYARDNIREDALLMGKTLATH